VTEEDAGKVVAAASAIRDALLSGDPPSAVTRAFTMLLRRAALAGVRILLVLDGVEHLHHSQPLYSASGALTREANSKLEGETKSGLPSTTRLAGMRAALKQARDLAERRASIDHDELHRLERRKQKEHKEGETSGPIKAIRRSSLAGPEDSYTPLPRPGRDDGPTYDPAKVAQRTRSTATKGGFGRRRSSVVLLPPLGGDDETLRLGDTSDQVDAGTDGAVGKGSSKDGASYGWIRPRRPLWWLPTSMPPGSRLILTTSSGSKAAAALRAKGMLDEAVRMPQMQASTRTAMALAILARDGPAGPGGLEFGFNHGLMIKHHLPLPAPAAIIDLGSAPELRGVVGPNEAPDTRFSRLRRRHAPKTAKLRVGTDGASSIASIQGSDGDTAAGIEQTMDRGIV